MISLNKLLYWEKIAEYYYENIHWATNRSPGIIDWVSQEFNATVTNVDSYITFNNPEDATYFVLIWS